MFEECLNFSVPYDMHNETLEIPSSSIRKLFKDLTSPSEVEKTTSACSETLYIMEAYYAIAREKFVDDFAVQCVEQALLDKVKDIFNPRITYSLEDEVIQDIAGETEDLVLRERRRRRSRPALSRR